LKASRLNDWKRRERFFSELLESRRYFAAVTFTPPQVIPINGSSTSTHTFTSAVTGDFNGDGNADFAVIDTSNNTIDVMLNNGNGTFKLSQQLPTGGQPGSLQVAALATGAVDLLFVNSLDGTVEFYSGTGKGLFSTPPFAQRFASASSSGPVTPDTVFAADINGDGLDDLVIGTPNSVITFLNSGVNGFSQELAVSGGLSNVGQFVTSSNFADAVRGLANGQIQIYLNAGAGLQLSSTTFNAVPSSLLNASSYTATKQIVVGDFNNDGNLDVATIISDSQTNTSFISVLPGKGDGTFSTAQLTSIPFGATTLAEGSFTTSGNEDLLALYANHTDVFTGTGTGTFSDAKLNIAVTNWNAAAVADFNGDGTVDAILNNTLLLNTSGLALATTAISSAVSVVAPGQRFALNASVSGKGGVPSGTVQFIDETNASSPIVLGTGTLNAGGKTKVVVNLGSKLQNHKIVAQYSGDTKFAFSSSLPVTVSVEKNGGIPIGPTILTPTILKSTVPASAPAGTKLTNSAVSVKLTNSTGTDASGSATVNAYAAATTTLNTSTDTLIATVKKPATLKISKTTTFSIPISSLPANLIGGTFHLVVQTVDPAGSATAALTPTFSVAAPFIALSERIASLNLPATISNGEKLHGSVKLVVTNNGNIADNGFTVDLSASSDSTTAGSSFLHIKKPMKLSPGKSVTFSVPIKSLPQLTAGSYFLVAQTTDANGATSLARSAAEFTVSA
jgi:hypothetical protein